VQNTNERTRNPGARTRRRPSWKLATLALLLLTCSAVSISALTGIAWSAGGSRPIDALASEPVPEPSNLADFVVDRGAAVALGKAFFWDMQTGSDGITSCATCHYNAGADTRTKNQINPKGAPFVNGGPNGQLSLADFPMHRLADPDNAASQLLSDTKNVVGSQSIASTTFVRVEPGSAVEIGTPVPDKVFNVAGNNVRQVTPRNAPTVVNAAFNFREQWDGKAQNRFNGVNPLGDRAPGVRVFDAQAPNQLAAFKPEIDDAALASQATGPMTNGGIMSFAGRTWKDIAVKLTSLRPLGEQAVSPSDSVLGPYADPSGKGLSVSYLDLIERAFAPRWWDSDESLVVKTSQDGSQAVVPRPAGALPANEATQLQANFSLFWGLAVQLYEASLVSDQTPVDQFLSGDDGALTAQEKAGMSVFTGKGRCSTCHAGPELTNAASAAVKENAETQTNFGGGGSGPVDTGFANLGVRPNSDDPGQNADDRAKNGLPLSNALLNKVPGSSPLSADGMFKIPGLRNVALTAPYFHNGSAATLRQVVEFYNRGGNFGTNTNPNKSTEIKPLSLNEQEKQDLVAFLEALTDPRVLLQQAPFDHPELLIPHGASGDTTSVSASTPGVADDEYLLLPAVGAGGAMRIQPFPNNPFVPGFLQQLPAGSFHPVTAPAAPAPATPAAPAPEQTTPVVAPAAPRPVAPKQAKAKRSVVTVSARVTVKRAARLRVRTIDPNGHRQLLLLAGSRLGSTVSHRDALVLSGRVAHRGKVMLRLRLLQSQLRHGRTYRIVVDTMGRRGVRATTRLEVKAP
jgi:cytochrome c peroxidase